MNYSLLDRIDDTEGAFLATILETEGHTYQKAGARALFRGGDVVPVHGNLGSLCADQDIVAAGSAACASGRPRRLRIDTTDASDADLGYGTFCGGIMDVLVEPLGASQRRVYRDVRACLERGDACYLAHDIEGGGLTAADTTPAPRAGVFVEAILPPQRVVIFGATPLSRRIARLLDDSDFDVHIADWRSAFLDACEDVDARRRHLDAFPVDGAAFAVVLSHSYRRDKDALRAALDAHCPFVGLLSSRPRREHMFEELLAEGVPRETIARVSSPVGIDIGSRGDAEIALAIAAELVKARHT
jgi:xanthine dehydrogenase accessory factor